jgi:hypothetical protein
MKTYVPLWQYLAELSLGMRNVSDERCIGSQNTHFMLNNSFPKIVRFIR